MTWRHRPKTFITDCAHVMRQWDTEKNAKLGLDPSKLGPGSGLRAWFKCPKGHSFFTKINYVLFRKSVRLKRATNGYFCPECHPRNYKPFVCENPKLMAIWDQEKNMELGLDPTQVRCGSRKKAWFLCPRTNCPEKCKHSFKRKIAVMNTFPERCPWCHGTSSRVFCVHNSAGGRHPHLLKEAKEPEELFRYTPHSGEKITWICSVMCPAGTCMHGEYESPIKNRVSGTGCHICGHRELGCQHNSVAFLFPKVAASLNRKKHPNVDLWKMFPGSQTYLWWICLKNPKHRSWRTQVSARTDNRTGKGRKHGTGCPSCKTSYMEESMAAVLCDLRDNASLDPTRWRIEKFKQGCHLKPERRYADFKVWLKTKTGRRQIVVVETDGEQHFDGKKFTLFGDPKKCLETNRRNDRLKDKLCQKLNYHLLRVSFSVPKSSFKNVVVAFFNRLQKNGHEDWLYEKVGQEYGAEPIVRRVHGSGQGFLTGRV